MGVRMNKNFNIIKIILSKLNVIKTQVSTLNLYPHRLYSYRLSFQVLPMGRFAWNLKRSKYTIANYLKKNLMISYSLIPLGLLNSTELPFFFPISDRAIGEKTEIFPSLTLASSSPTT